MTIFSANNKNMRGFVSRLCTPSNLLPVVLLEGTVMAGRTYQANERGGKVEARERITEESITAVIWLFGIGFVNKGLDLLIKNFSKINEKTGKKDFSFDFDTGKDHIRQPFERITEGMSKKQKNTIAALKFSKIVASAAICVGFMGFVLPKLNQKITNNMLQKQEQKTGEHPTPIKIDHQKTKKLDINEFLVMSRGSAGDPKFSSSQPKKMDINEFLTMSRGSVGDPNFGDGSFFELAAHQLENDNITQLLTIDGGLFTGRAVNARNEYERREILFRDLTSSFFYVAATPLIYKGLCAIDSLKGKNTELSPNRAHDLHEKLLTTFEKDSTQMSKEEFIKRVLGKREVSDDVFNKAGSIFEKDIVTVDKMHKFIENNIVDSKLATNLKEKSIKLSKLQPSTKSGQNILTKSQLTNLFHSGIINDADTINHLINECTDKRAMNPIKFIAQKQVDSKRQSIVNYAESIVEKATKENKDSISISFLEKMKNRNLKTKLGYWGAGMAVSAFFLSTGIPKMQYWITRKTTGHNDFPGIQQYEKEKKEKQQKWTA